MSVAKRPLADPRNTYLVSDDDPGAFDKSYAGRHGVHSEQRCCGDRAPYMEGNSLQSGYYVNAAGTRVANIIEYWARPENKALAANGWWNAPTPPGYIVEMTFIPTELYCHECETAIEQAWADNFLPTFDAMKPVFHGIAMAVSYIPVFGTAVAFSIEASLSLAEGNRIDTAALDAIGGALPGQPASGMAFSAVRSLVAGDRIDKVAIQTLGGALHLDATTVQALSTAVDIFERIAQGEKFTDTALTEIYNNLPDNAQKAMDVAKQLANGDNVASTAEKALGKEAADAMTNAAGLARSQGQAAVNSFIAQSGYQAALDSVPPQLKDAVNAAMMAGTIDRAADQNTGGAMAFTTGDTNQADNDARQRAGKIIIATPNVTWRNVYDNSLKTLAQVEAGNSLTLIQSGIDPLTSVARTGAVTYTIDYTWRRGFEVGIATCNGMSADGPGQQKIRASLTLIQTQRGFDAAQQIQFDRSKQYSLLKPATAKVDTNMAVALGRIVLNQISPDDRTQIENYARKGALIAQGNPIVAAGRDLSNRSTKPGDFRWGFDVGSSIAQGQTINGPGKEAVRTKLGPYYLGAGPVVDGVDGVPAGPSDGSTEAQQGFDVACSLQYGLTKQGGNVPATVAAGAAIANGATGASGLTADQKANVVGVAMSSPGTGAGAATAVTAKTGFWHSIAAFFGLG